MLIKESFYLTEKEGLDLLDSLSQPSVFLRCHHLPNLSIFL